MSLFYRLLLAAALVAGVTSASAVQASETVYWNDFQSGVLGPEWVSDSAAPWGVQSTPDPADGSRRFLGYFGGDNRTTLTIDGIPAWATSLRLTFDVYMMWSWDGEDARPADGVPRGPDFFGFTYGDSDALAQEWTFSLGAGPQSFCPGEAAPCVPTTGAVERYTLGYFFGIEPIPEDEVTTRDKPMSVVYAFDYAVPHSGPTATFTFYSRGLQVRDDLSFRYLDEAWGLDNVLVTAVPEPGKWALLLAGLGLIPRALRRRATRS